MDQNLLNLSRITVHPAARLRHKQPYNQYLLYQSVWLFRRIVYLCIRIIQFDYQNIIDMEIKIYKSPQAEVIEVNVQGVLCGSLDGSPITNEYNRGSESYVGFGDDEDD